MGTSFVVYGELSKKYTTLFKYPICGDILNIEVV